MRNGGSETWRMISSILFMSYLYLFGLFYSSVWNNNIRILLWSLDWWMGRSLAPLVYGPAQPAVASHWSMDCWMGQNSTNLRLLLVLLAANGKYMRPSVPVSTLQELRSRSKPDLGPAQQPPSFNACLNSGVLFMWSLYNSQHYNLS